MTAYTRQLADFAANIGDANVPADVTTRAKEIILDSLGCALHAIDLPAIAILAKVVRRLEPNGGRATIWGRAETASPVNAALVNGAMIQAHELDDGNPVGAIRTSAALLSAAVAAAEIRGADEVSGRRFLRAVIAGCEAGPRIGLCMNGGAMVKAGWHVPGVFSSFPAAVAASVVLGLDSDQMLHALGIAGTQACGLSAAQSDSMLKCVQCAKGAQSGLYAALLAADGFTGIENVFDERFGGFCSVFGGDSGKVNAHALVDGLGEHWETMGIGIKVYACAGGNQSAVCAIEELMVETGLTVDDVEQITVSVPQNVVRLHGWSPYVPDGLRRAQMHLGYCVAMQLIEGTVSIDQMTAANTARTDLIDLTNRVKVVRGIEREQKGEAYRKGCDVEVRLKNGDVLSKTVDSRTGIDQPPLSSKRIAMKFEHLAAKALAPAQIAQLHSTIVNLDTAATVYPLLSILGGVRTAGT